MPRYECHDVCHFFPPMSEEELAELKKDIQANRVQTAVVLWRNPEQENKTVIIDGRHRAAICEELGGEYLDYPTREYKGTAEEMVRHITSLNLHRRHLNSGQKAAAFVKADGMIQAIRKARETKQPIDTGLRSSPPDAAGPKQRTRDLAAKEAGTSSAQIFRAQEVAAADPGKLDEVIAGKKTLTTAQREVRADKAVTSKAPVEPATKAKEPTLDERMKQWNGLLEDWADEFTTAGKNPPDGLDETTLGIIRDQVKSVVSTIRAQRGVAPCDYCGGKACPKCNDLGWLNRSRHESAPKKNKAA
jgi:ParB-like chromosome segregation protein Spo0J